MRDNPWSQSGDRGHHLREALVSQRGHPEGAKDRIVCCDIAAKVGGITEGVLALSVSSVEGSRDFRVLCLQLAVPPFQVVAPIPGRDQGRFHHDDALGLASEGI